MKKIKLFDKKIPTRNYFIVLVVSVLVIIACLYLRTFYLTYRNNKLSTSVFSSQKIKQINTKDINFALTETGDVLLYVSYTGNNDIYNKYYPDKFQFMIEKMRETEELRERTLGRPFSVISSNPKYNADYLEHIVKTKWLKKLNEMEVTDND